MLQNPPELWFGRVFTVEIFYGFCYNRNRNTTLYSRMIDRRVGA